MSSARQDKGKQPAGAGRRRRRIRTTPSQEPFTWLDTDDSLLASPVPVVPSPEAAGISRASLLTRPPVPSEAPDGSHPPHLSTPSPGSSTQPPSDFEGDISRSPPSSGRSRERIHIDPQGHEFCSQVRYVQTRCARRIGKIIESKFNGPWKSYKQVPIDVRDLWFSEFEKSFTWNEEDRVAIRKVFDHVGSNSLKNRIYDAKSTNQRPLWITPRSWDALQEQWSMETHKMICEKNKRNRESDCGGQGFPLHVGGSITQMTHNEKLKAKLGHEPTVPESFMHTHSRMNPQGERVWVDERSRNLHAKYIERYENQSSDGGSNSTPTPMSTQIERWTELAGGPNKGRVYGLGGMARAHASGSHGRGHTQRERELETEVQGLRQEMSEMRTSQAAQMEAMMAAQAAQMADMWTQMNEMRSMLAQQQQPRTTSTQLPYPTLPHGSTTQAAQGTTAGFVSTPFYPPRPSHIDREGSQEGESEEH